ncbi:NEL domain-containing protein, partial [Pseudomonas sp. TNT11]
ATAHALSGRTRLDRNALDDDQRTLYERYRSEAGLDPYRTYEPQGSSDPWLAGVDANTRRIREQLWDAVEDEHGSQGFFEVIKLLEPPEFFENPQDQQRYALNQAQLTQRVWRLINATHADSALRERLFKLSSFPGLCGDGGAQIFNEMGIEVMASEARRFSVTLPELEGRLVTLAKGAARLKHLNQVAQAEVARRLRPKAAGGEGLHLRSERVDGEAGEVDEVDIHLAYQTALANLLDLPWLSDHMLYRDTANVSPPQIQQAYTTVQALGQGDGLVNQILLEPYWETFLQQTYDTLSQQNASAYTEKFYRLDDLQTLQAQWREEQEPQQKDRLKNKLKALADELETTESVVLTDTPISEALNNRLLNDLGYKEKEWMRGLTREALKKARQRHNREPLPEQ